MGCATFGHLDELTQQALSKVIGVDAVLRMPYYECRTGSDLFRMLVLIANKKEKAKENKSFLLYHLPQPEKKGRKVWKTSSACAG